MPRSDSVPSGRRDARRRAAAATTTTGPRRRARSAEDRLDSILDALMAVRKGDFKLVASAPDGVNNVKLFNLKEDIGEAKDLAAAMPEKVKELKADWDKWNAENIDPLWVPAKKKDKKDEDDD